MKIIERIIQIMKEKGITAYMLEKETGIKQTSFSSWKRGVEPPASKIETIMQYLDVSPNEIYGYDQGRDLLNEPQKEMISIMEKMEVKEQWKAVGVIENYSQNIKSEIDDKSEELSISKIS